MTTLDPIYTEINCEFAYQLRWGVTVFWRQSPPEAAGIESLAAALEDDGIRILSSRSIEQNGMQFALSTLPGVRPVTIIHRLKGRLQYIVRDHTPRALRPHYSIRSFGTQDRNVIEAYVARQPQKHSMASTMSQQIFEDLLFCDPAIDLSISQKTSHGDYWYNLHLVLVHEDRWRSVDRKQLTKTHRVVRQCAMKKQWRLSRFAILSDHMHMTIGCSMHESPAEVTLSLMNNVAWAYGMKPMLSFSAFVGTFGEYDQRSVAGNRA